MSQKGIVINAVIIKNNKRELVVKNKIKRFFTCDTFREILIVVYSSAKDASDIQVHVSSSIERKEEAEIGIDETVSLANEIFIVKTVKYTITFETEECVAGNSSRSMVEVLMKKSLSILKTLPEKDKKIALHNEIINDVQKSLSLHHSPRKMDTK